MAEKSKRVARARKNSNAARSTPARYIARARGEITEWEQQGPGWIAKGAGYVIAPVEKLVARAIPAAVQRAAEAATAKTLDTIFAVSGRTFSATKIQAAVAKRAGPKPSSADLLAAADAEAKSIRRWAIGMTAAEGGATGAIGAPGLVADIPALLTLSMRTIRSIGACYGYDTGTPSEKDYALHVLRTGSAVDPRLKLEALLALKEVEQILLKVSWKQMASSLAARQMSTHSLLAAIRQLAKTLGVDLTKRKALQSIPFIGAAVGAAFNATFINDISRSAYMNFRRRWIAEHDLPPTAVATPSTRQLTGQRTVL